MRASVKYLKFLLFCVLLCSCLDSWSETKRCAPLFTPEEMAGANFLAQKMGQLSKDEQIALAVEFLDNQPPDIKASEALAIWLRHLQGLIDEPKIDQDKIEELRLWFYSKYIIKVENIPNSFFVKVNHMYYEHGVDVSSNTAEEKEKKISLALVKAQRISFDYWFDYLFLSPQLSETPLWVKVWVLSELGQMGAYNPHQLNFLGRTLDTVSRFPELKPWALNKIINLVLKSVNEEALPKNEDPNLLALLKKKNFSMMYAQAMILVEPYNGSLAVTEGQWVYFAKDSPFEPMCKSLEGAGVNWCLSNSFQAEVYMSIGGIYIYYSKGFSGNYDQPRLAIRIKANKVIEVRGIAEAQTLDSYIAQTPILENKLKTLPGDHSLYLQKLEHTRKLIEIEDKINKMQELSQADLLFLYELNEPIIGFSLPGHKDFRLSNITKTRVRNMDLARIFNVDQDKVTQYKEDIIDGRATVFYGDLEVLPGQYFLSLQVVIGKVVAIQAEETQYLKNLKYISKGAEFQELRSAENLTGLEYVGGDLSIPNLPASEYSKLNSNLKIKGNLVSNLMSYKDGEFLPKEKSKK